MDLLEAFILDENNILDIQSAAKLQKQIFQALDSGIKELRLDLGNLSYLDSEGIAFLILILRRIIQINDGCLILLNVRPQVSKILDISALEKLVSPSQLIIDRISPVDYIPAIYHDAIPGKSFIEEISINCRAGDLNCVREKLKDIIFKLGFDEELSYDILVAVSEACSNSIEHSGCRSDQVIKIKFSYQNGIFTAELKDFGGGFDPDSVMRKLPKGLSARGRGLFIIKALMDEVHFETHSDGMYIKMQKIVL